MNIIRIQGDFERRQGVYYEYDRDSQPLGEGGMGRIYQGYMVNEMSGGFRRPVAIKEIHDHIARDPQLIERAQRESSIQIDHENLLRMYGFVPNMEYNPMQNANIVRYYMIMERLVGVNLDQIVNGVVTDKSGMHIPYAQSIHDLYFTNRTEAIVKIARNILSGIMALHDKNYIHRDIDPSNIMITIDNKIKLIDFGVCKNINLLAKDKSLTQAGSFIGKVNYAAPELVLGDLAHQNATTDLYAVGILLYQLAVGHLPFTGTNQDVMAAHIQRKLPVNDIADKDLRRIVEKATQKKQEKRYQSAAEMIVDLETILRRNTHAPQSSYSTGSGGQSYQANTSSTKTPLLLLLAALAGLIVGLVIKLITIL